MSYVVALPSYKRSKLLLKNTLNVLITGQIDSDRIYIFVANEDEYDTYIQDIPK